MKKYYSVLFCQLCIGCLAQAGHAALAARASTLMDEVVVTAARTPESIKGVSSHLTVIDDEELQQSPARNVGELLAEKGIGHIQRYPGSITSIGLRGFRSDSLGNDLQGHVLILLDGRRAGTGNLAKILTKNVERIEVIHGPGAVQYGSGGMGGVINIITRQGQQSSAFVESGAGSFGAAEGSIGGTIKEGGLDFAGVYAYGTTGDYDTGDGSRYDNTGIDHESGESANIGYSFSETNRLGLVFTRFNLEDAGSPGYFSSIDRDDSTSKSNYSVDATYRGETTSGKINWLTRFFFGQDKNSWLDGNASDPACRDTGLGSNNKTDQRGAQAQIGGTVGATALTAGFDWLDYQVKNSWTPARTGYTNPALFVLGKTAFLDDRLFANVGLRYDRYLVEVKEPQGREEDRERLTPKAGLAWMVLEDLKVRAEYGQGFMMPSAGQLAADYPSFGGRIVGNPDLDPEKSTTYEGGVEFDWGSFTGTLTYFHTDFADKITLEHLTNGNTTWKNLGEATLAGFETECSYDLGTAFSWDWEIKPTLNLTYLTKFEDRENGDNLQYVSAVNVAGGLTVGNGAGTFIRLNLAYSGSQDVQDWESGTYPTPVVELDSVAVTDLSAACRFLETRNYGTFTLRGEINNLFDEEYAYVKGYPMPGRCFFVSLRWDY